MPFKSELPQWDHNTGPTPLSAKKKAGWLPQDRPPAELMNKLVYLTYYINLYKRYKNVEFRKSNTNRLKTFVKTVLVQPIQI